jgi:hypothetical protein
MNVFFPHPIRVLYFLICTFLSHLKLSYNFLFASNFETLYLFNYLVFIFEIVRSVMKMQN